MDVEKQLKPELIESNDPGIKYLRRLGEVHRSSLGITETEERKEEPKWQKRPKRD